LRNIVEASHGMNVAYPLPRTACDFQIPTSYMKQKNSGLQLYDH